MKDSQNNKFKVVVFLGKNIEDREEILKSTNYSDKDVAIISGRIRDINLSNLQGRTDENTLFIVNAHGSNIRTKNEDGTTTITHFTDDLEDLQDAQTDKFFNHLKATLHPNHNIDAMLFSCYAGSVLKRGKIDKGISLLIRASSKHPTIVNQNADTILKILNWKIKEDDISNQVIYSRLLWQDPETFYYKSANDDEVTKFPRACLQTY